MTGSLAGLLVGGKHCRGLHVSDFDPRVLAGAAAGLADAAADRASLLLSFRKGRWWSRSLLFLGVLLLGVTGFTTFGYALITPLENRFVRPTEPVHIDGIVVLGGGMDGEVDTVRHGWEFNQSGDRMVEALRLALMHPEAKVVIAAGPAALALDQEPEAYAAQRF